MQPRITLNQKATLYRLSPTAGFVLISSLLLIRDMDDPFWVRQKILCLITDLTIVFEPEKELLRLIENIFKKKMPGGLLFTFVL